MSRQSRGPGGEVQGVLRLAPAGTCADGATSSTVAPFVPGPNPDLPEFIARHSTPYDAAHDDYDVPAFDRDLVGQKTSSLYTFHSYWSKKDPALINHYVCHYTKPGALVLDPFCGSGTTGLAALWSNRVPVLIDASPSASLLAHFCCLPGEPQDVTAALERLLDKAEAEVDQLFATRCDRCGGEAVTEYVIYSERYQCPNCAELVALWDCPELKVGYPARKGRVEQKKRRVCPHCLGRNGGEPHRDFVVTTRSQKFGAVPVLVRYRCETGCRPAIDERRHNDPVERKRRYFREHDLARIEHIEAAEVPHWYPRRKMMDVDDDSRPWGTEWRPGRNFRSVAALYTKRNLWALGALRAALPEGDLGRLETVLFTGLLHKCSVLMGCRDDQVGRITSGTYYIAPLRMECRPTKYLREAVSDLKRHFAAKTEHAYQGSEVLISASDAVSALAGVPDQSVDYVFTDPPYAGTVQYGELNFVWEAWLGLDGTWLSDEIIINPFRDKGLAQWEASVRKVFAQVYRVLKPGRWASVCYHDTSPTTWTVMQNVLLDLGFEIESVTAQSTSQKSVNQTTCEKVVKSDLVLNCRKPRPGEARDGQGEAGLVSTRVRDILIETLSTHAGLRRDKLWDVVLKRLLTRGQMAEHRFDDLLTEVATRSESGGWFLKAEFEALSESDVKNEEEAGLALERFVRLRSMGVPAQFAAEIALKTPRLAEMDEAAVTSHIRDTFLRGSPEAAKFTLGGRLKGIEFYDCLFFYLTRFLKGRGSGRTPRRNLADFINEYLVRFRDGDKWLYRPADPSEAAALRSARRSGLGRRVRQYVSYLRGEGDYPADRLPDPKTLVAWLKHCASFGLAEEGVALFEKGGLAGRLHALSDDERYDAEDYYDQCRRRAGKDAGVPGDDADEPEAHEEEV